MVQAKPRVLLNAEAFGFGPAAAIAEIAQHLIGHGITVGYIGEGHSLDLQKDPSYHAVFDVSQMSQGQRQKRLRKIAADYELFLTAMDFGMADLAKAAGMKVVIYDALAWYWSEIPPQVYVADTYIIQNFFGVETRIGADFRLREHTKLVAPLVTKIPARKQGRHVLLNLGGLQNPFWSFADTLLYAREITQAVKACMPAGQKLLVAASAKVAAELGDAAAYSRREMSKILADSKYALMTPGLGNIYDSAAHNLPTLWLPPANDSQGRQADLLARHRLCDARLDWRDFSKPIDYTAAQPQVLDDILVALQRLASQDSTKIKIAGVLAAKLSRLQFTQDAGASRLLEIFGSNGANTIAKIIVDMIETGANASD